MLHRFIYLQLALCFFVDVSAQNAGTITVTKLVVPDTIMVPYGDRKIFKRKRVKYKPNPAGNTLVCIDYHFRKGIPEGYYIVTYVESESIYCLGTIEEGEMHGAWRFYKTNGQIYSAREYYYGKLIGKPRFLSLRE